MDMKLFFTSISWCVFRLCRSGVTVNAKSNLSSWINPVYVGLIANQICLHRRFFIDNFDPDHQIFLLEMNIFFFLIISHQTKQQMFLRHKSLLEVKERVRTIKNVTRRQNTTNNIVYILLKIGKHSIEPTVATINYNSEIRWPIVLQLYSWSGIARKRKAHQNCCTA